jgi:hypothetical protein
MSLVPMRKMNGKNMNFDFDSIALNTKKIRMPDNTAIEIASVINPINRNTLFL